MLEIFLKTLPFFALIGLGWCAGKARFFPPEASVWLTKFVFFFPLSAMIFKFSAALDLRTLFDPAFMLAYITGSGALWLLTFGVAKARGEPTVLAAMESNTSMTGNTGFLGVPMLAVILGPQAVGPILMVLSCDLIVFTSIITIIVTATRHGKISLAPIVSGLIGNPMIMSMAAGLIWAGFSLPMPGPLDDFVTILGAAATPGALFAIGASLADKSAERPGPALWLSFGKLILHPCAVAITALLIFHVDPFAAGVMICAAALPVAGNVYILAQHFGVAPQRVSAAILFSTAVSILTIPAVIHWVQG
ncbi:AEC family transporter [Thioclava sp. BHET1]|nr:AEC family transporter [Thioclava sp. BHET1]